MSRHPEAFAAAKLDWEENPLPLMRHDPAAMQELIDRFPEEMNTLALGCSLDRPTGERQDPPASIIYGISRDEGKEVNRTSANNHLANIALAGGEVSYRSFVDIQRKRSPDTVLTRRSFNELHALLKFLFADPKDVETFRSLNMYADMGKSDALIAWATTVDELRGSTDHDKIIATLLQPEHETAQRQFVPSFERLDSEQQTIVRNILSCPFRFPQLNNGQALPKDLEAFYQLTLKEQRLLIAQEFFDIAGSEGDTITNGTDTIDEPTYRRLRGTIAILLSAKTEHLPAAERAQDSFDRVLAFRDERFGFGFDLEDPGDSLPRGFVRLGMMFRDLSVEHIVRIPHLFRTKLNSITQAHLVDFLNATGYEPEGGAIKSMYSSTAASRLLKGAIESGNTFDDAMVVTLQFLARLNAGARRNIDMTDTVVTNVVARDLVLAASNRWWDLLRHEIVAKKVGRGQAHFLLKRQPTLSVRARGIDTFEHPTQLALPTHNGLWIGGGGGSDIYTTAFLAQSVFAQENPTLVSVWGTPSRIRNARPLGNTGRIFQVNPETVIDRTRHFEHLVAARGLRTILVCLECTQEGRRQLQEDLQHIADSLHETPTHINLVDTGGDILEASSLHAQRPERDHISLEAALYLHKQGIDIGNVMIAAPGVDAPDTMDQIAQHTGVAIYDLSPHAEAFYRQAQKDDVLTDNPARYSRMLQSLWYALHPRTIANRSYVAQPLLLPLEQAMRRKNARPAFATITEQMHHLHIYNLARLATTLGIN